MRCYRAKSWNDVCFAIPASTVDTWKNTCSASFSDESSLLHIQIHTHQANEHTSVNIRLCHPKYTTFVEPKLGSGVRNAVRKLPLPVGLIYAYVTPPAKSAEPSPPHTRTSSSSHDPSFNIVTWTSLFSGRRIRKGQLAHETTSSNTNWWNNSQKCNSIYWI